MNLILRGLAGSTIEFTKIKFGNGEEQGVTAVDLSNPIMEVPISSITRDSNFITLGADYKNADVPTEFSALEIGVFAKDPDDDTKEILYCLWYEEDPVKADYISPVEDRILGTKLEILVFVDTVENVTAVMAEASEFTTKVEFKRHLNDTGNPHNVTQEQIGLGLIVNALPEDQTPEFSTTNSEYKLNDKTGKYSFSNIFSGEKVGSILQKVRTIIKLVIEHFNASNPHGVTYKKIGAAPSSHYHSTNDINSGVLGIARGGTGGGTAAEARVQLGIQSGQVTTTILTGEKHYIEVQYPTAFKERPPMVVAMPLGDAEAALEIRCTALRKNGFSAFLYSPTYSGTVTFNWIACE